MLLLSILYRLLRSLLGLTAVLMRRDLSKDAELLVLRQENTVLRRQVSRVRYTPADRVWLAALSCLVPRRRWTEVFPVSPATILTWHRRVVSRRWDYTARRRPGRPPTAAAIENLVIRMASERHRQFTEVVWRYGHGWIGRVGLRGLSGRCGRAGDGALPRAVVERLLLPPSEHRLLAGQGNASPLTAS
jgi:putative transposase